jgi:hypothetical protein
MSFRCVIRSREELHEWFSLGIEFSVDEVTEIDERVYIAY